ncbi:hypothetical protein RDV64_11550 [Acuticoccus sp. MNP-M23]|uniref:hypothetical protein n=1 Tax=Acuticoccus sp. MNP-M23 TaxID=3072793 RepID=UPI0028164F45|nr:hypothetical protein [Acuticoccus sp. MNP-M23]WMS44976.1 hypothetical protein RDV64_11550 [Acuticoccus sp. MNP-M23]
MLRYADRLRAALVAGVVVAGSLAAPSFAQTPAPATDFLKRAGNFLANCDARPDAGGTRPDANFVCLGFMAGLIEGYTTAAVANGNPQPYCLPRPVTLVEMMDMMTTVIERGVPDTMPTAAVFHLILETNFSCAPNDAEAVAADPAEPGTPSLPATPAEPAAPTVPAGPAGAAAPGTGN